MANYFEVIFLEDAFDFLQSLDKKYYEKILFNIRKVQTEANSELFKKLQEDIWEFRTQYQGLHYRLLAFWDKTNSSQTLVVSTHGFVKKQSKVDKKEIKKAIIQRAQYFELKKQKKK